MALVLWLLLAVIFPFETLGRCTLSFDEFACSETNLTKLLQEFYENSCESRDYSPKLTVNVVNSNFNVIEYFPNLPTTFRNFTITHLAIRNSTVEHIYQNALEELWHLESLDLSRNRLRNILFVEFLPNHVKYLHLSHNNITYLDNVFRKLEGLFYLDLSHNRINIIDLNNVYWIDGLNFSYNNITTLIPTESDSRINTINLSHNRLIEVNEPTLNVVFNYLDLSYNTLQVVKLNRGERSSLNLSGNKNNKITLLDSSVIKIFRFEGFSTEVDLSNSSIEDIPELYFSGLELYLLNLSWNNISYLKTGIFRDTVFNMLDLSYSNIRHIHKEVFKNMVSEKINLKGNKLTNIKNSFTKVRVEQLDLSFNVLQHVSNKSFSSCYNLKILNMSNCLIEQIEPQAFFNLNELEVLDLSHNKLHVLTNNMFNNLPVTDLRLHTNKINTVRTQAFDNLYNLTVLDLSRVGIRELEPDAFTNSPNLEVIDLSHNNITAIPDQLFVNVDKLKAVYFEGNNITTLHFFSNHIKFHNLTLSFNGIFKANRILNLNINYLSITDSKIDVLQSNSFAGLYNLVELHLDGSLVSHIEPGALNKLYNLKFLDSQVLFRQKKVIAAGIFHDLRSLKFLNLSGLSLETLAPKTFLGLRSLKTLLLSKNTLRRLNAGTFYGLNSLNILDVSRCDIDLCDDRSFGGLESLEILHLEFNYLSAIGSNILFDDLSRLLELHLEHNNISSLGINSFSGLKSIRRLYLQNNSIVEFPVGLFHHLPTLISLDLSNNNMQLLKTGALSNLRSLEVLDLSDNELVNLEYVDIFFSLRQLRSVRFDGNHLKQFDFRRFLINLKKLEYIGISHNKWKCDNLSYIIESFNNRSINYKPIKPVYDNDNIDGIGCVDLCKFVYCSHENVEHTLHYY